MTSEEAKLVNYWLEYKKYFKMCEQAINEQIEKIFKKRLDETFDKYFAIWVLINKEKLESKYIEDYHNEALDDDIADILNSNDFYVYCIECCQEQLNDSL